MMPGIPTDVDGLTPEWLTAAFSTSPALNDRRAITAVDVEPLGDEKGFFSQLYRLRLDDEGPRGTAPSRIIAKLSAASSSMRKRPQTIRAYEREVRFYRHLASETGLSVPDCYYADIDTSTGHHILLLEDLSPALNGSRIAGCTPQQAELAVREIAGFHAQWWESPRLAGLDWIEDPIYDPAQLIEAHAGWWPAFLRQAGHQLPDPLIDFGEQLGRYRAELSELLWSTPPRTLTHADFNLDNMFFASDEGEGRFTLIDWQAIGHKRGIWDIAWLLGQNLEPDMRAAMEIDLLTAYVETMADNGVQDYSLDRSLHDYKLCLLHRFGSLISTIAAMPFTPAQIQLHIDILLPRNVAAIIDNDAVAALD